MSGGLSINFGDNAQIKNLQTGENAKVVEGDEVQGDKIGNQTNVAGDVHGDVNQTQVNGSVTLQEVKERVAACVDSLSKVFEAKAGGDTPNQPTEEFGDDFSPIAIDPEDHPQSLLSATLEISDRVEGGEEVSEEEVEEVKSGWRRMLDKAGKYGAIALKSVGPIAVAGIEALASQPPPPWNVLSAVIKAGVDQFSDQ
jgi:hypothetical protein